MVFPPQVKKALSLFERAGEEAWLVGGCVRDTLLGRVPHDWDLATSALPDETLSIFAGYETVVTGLKYGTVTVMIDGLPLEITTFRVDGEYSDSRRPDEVHFTRSIVEDLARRDFTVSSMAFHPDRGLLDPFGGKEDLQRGILRCVGEPALRFREDALRILRALRFSALFGFTIEENTRDSMIEERELLRRVAPERVSAELAKLLIGPFAGRVLRGYFQIFAVILPELSPLWGFPCEGFDVYEHTVRCVESIGPEVPLRLCMLLHDIARPFCHQKERGKIVGYAGHCEKGAQMAEQALCRLRFDRKTVRTVAQLIALHDEPFSADRTGVCRLLSRIGVERFFQLIAVKKADAMGQREPDASAVIRLGQMRAQGFSLLLEGAPYRLGHLAVDGEDLLRLGVPAGRRIGEVLERLLLEVMEGKVPNEKSSLLARAEEIAKVLK